MSIQLVFLSGFMILVALLTIVKPALVFEYPVAVCTLMSVFMLPQAWYIEQQGDLMDFEPTTTWSYMILCMAATIAGYVVGRLHKRKVVDYRNTVINDFDMNRLFIGVLILWIVGGIAVILMIRQARTMEFGQLWTGVIAFYAMVSSLFLYASALSWVVYLHKRKWSFLVLAVLGLVILSGQFLWGARREGSFVIGVTIILGIYFVKKKMIGRIVLIPLLLVGTLLVNQAGAIRSHIINNNSNIVDALSSQEIVSQGINTQATEVSSAVSDIAITSWSDQYRFLTPFYNHIVNLYVPAFILGRDFKDNLMIKVEEESSASRYVFSGSTRTGFAETFQSLHYFGCLIFFGIAYMMGRLWTKAIRGDLVSQVFYMLLLSGSLKVITEDASSFFGVMPLLFGSIGVVFFFSKKDRTRSAAREDVVAYRRADPAGDGHVEYGA